VTTRDKAQESTPTNAVINFNTPSAASMSHKNKWKQDENGKNLDERSELVKLRTKKLK
jgi:hypothetical protein